MFDEPSSYLDVKQRLAVAHAIRDLVTQDNYTIVVEHDLAVLDYLSDFICVLYGVPTAYGVVTMPSGVREGAPSLPCPSPPPSLPRRLWRTEPRLLALVAQRDRVLVSRPIASHCCAPPRSFGAARITCAAAAPVIRLPLSRFHLLL